MIPVIAAFSFDYAAMTSEEILNWPHPMTTQGISLLAYS